jgi:DNA-binding beta-propeller fold protein YncE
MLNIDYPAIYVVNGSSNDISVIRISDNTVTEAIELNGAKFPHHIYLNPTKTQLAVAITSTDLSGGHAGHAGHGESDDGLSIQVINAITGMLTKKNQVVKNAT